MPVALLLLLLPAAFGAAAIRIVSPVTPSAGVLICKGRVLHARAAVSSFSTLAESAQISFLVDGQQVALVTARSHSEVLIPFMI